MSRVCIDLYHKQTGMNKSPTIEHGSWSTVGHLTMAQSMCTASPLWSFGALVGPFPAFCLGFISSRVLLCATSSVCVSQPLWLLINFTRPSLVHPPWICQFLLIQWVSSVPAFFPCVILPSICYPVIWDFRFVSHDACIIWTMLDRSIAAFECLLPFLIVLF